MLSIQNIRKEYKTGDLIQTALDGVSLNFRDNEFVAILGPSGSGKTTLLNIVGGLDRYDSGDLIINGISTKKYRDRDWDSYRNHTIGFVFQSYNLIPHQSVLANVELSLTISGISKSERRKRAKEALERVGLGEQLHKRPNQMSGGQMQRVAIARALVNDPDILLADEPTGALDSETSVQVMELLNEVAKDRLVIMVTHNPDLAERYATRTVKLNDGKITDDSNPFDPQEEQSEPVHKNMGKSSMSFLTALSLSFNNLRTKKGRTILTAFAGSIGIIGIALILSLSNGVNTYINDIQKSTMASYPITIEEQTFDLSSLMEMSSSDAGKNNTVDHELDAVYSDGSQLQSLSQMATSITENNLTAFKKYLDNKDSAIHEYIGENGIVYSYATKFNVYTYDSQGAFVNADGSTLDIASAYGTATMSSGSYSFTTGVSNSLPFEELIPSADGKGISTAITDNYDLVYGRMPETYNELVLVLDENNEVYLTQLYQLGFLPTADYKALNDEIRSGGEVTIKQYSLNYEDICKQKYYLIPECDLYEKENDSYVNISADTDAIEKRLDNALELHIVGVIRTSSDITVPLLHSPIGYTKMLTDYLIEYTDNSDIVKAQRADTEKSIISGLRFNPGTDAEKAADAAAYLSSLGISDKAKFFESIMPAILSKFMEGAAGMPQTSPIGSIPFMTGNMDSAEMTEQQLADALDSFLENPDEEIMITVYDNYISSASYEDALEALGVVSLDAPSSISLYVDSFEAKEGVASCIEEYNRKADEEDAITYTDYVGLLMSSVTTIINVIAYVLIAFVAVSLVVSSIMIGIITYISVLERTKEIGILRAIGASKRNISQVFNAETFIIGLLSGIIGIGCTLIMLLPINEIIHVITGIDNVNAILPLDAAVVLIILSVLLTCIGGLIPSKKASKRDPVTALRTE